MTAAEKWRNLLAFAYIIFLALWFSLSIKEIADTQQAGKLFFRRDAGEPYICDFVNHYQTGCIILSDDRLKVYDPEVQLKWTNKLIAPDKIEKPFYWQYPPYVCPFMVPLALLPMDLSFWARNIFNLLFGAACLTLILKTPGKLEADKFKYFLLGAAASAPSLISLRLSQMSWMMVGILAIYWWSYSSRKDIAAGIALALSTIKPQYTLFLMVPVLINGRIKTFISNILAELLLITLGGETAGWSNVINYPSILLSAELPGEFVGLSPEKMVNISPLLQKFVPFSAGMTGHIALLLIGLAITVTAWLGARAKRELTVPWAIAITSIGSLLFSPHTHVQDLVFLAIPAAVTLITIQPVTTFELRPMATRIWHAGLVFFPILSWGLFLTQAISGRPDLHLFTWFNLIMLMLAFVCLKDESKRSTITPF